MERGALWVLGSVSANTRVDPIPPGFTPPALSTGAYSAATRKSAHEGICCDHYVVKWTENTTKIRLASHSFHLLTWVLLIGEGCHWRGGAAQHILRQRQRGCHGWACKGTGSQGCKHDCTPCCALQGQLWRDEDFAAQECTAHRPAQPSRTLRGRGKVLWSPLGARKGTKVTEESLSP